MTSTHTNRLAQETSPYLLQHAHNPVNWYPWGPEALELAATSDKPIFLSIGYSACHWCHVMEHESFESEQVAALMNEHFINIKVDREERPDLDEIYMKAVQRMTGSGGWPMSVFLTPDCRPFFGGTYFPPFGSHGRPGFADVLTHLSRAWATDKGKVEQQGERLAQEIAREGSADGNAEVDPGCLDHSLKMLRENYDVVWGGFGEAPKFPHSGDLRIMLRHHLRTGAQDALDKVTFTLDKMACGGIYDQLGGGFHRYSTDERWLIPHFEKMLYDNALLIPAYLEAHLVTGEERFARIARECCEWVLREMVTPEGGFASTQDADSEGQEGTFFVWEPDELARVLGPDTGRWAQEWYGVTDGGNFEHGKSALWRPESAEDVAAALRVPLAELESAMESARQKLFEARESRVHPGWDDKILTAWNGLMISALAMAHQVLGEERYLNSAQTAAAYVLGHMRQEDGRLFATARGGHAHIDGCLDDYAFLIQGLIDLYESDFDEGWLRQALELNAILQSEFVDEAHGGYFTTGERHETLIARLKNPHDGALPAGNGVQALNLLRLAELTGAGELASQAEASIRAQGALVNRYPVAFSQLLMALDFLAAGPREIVISGEPQDEGVAAMLSAVRATFLPQRVVALARSGADADLIPLVQDRLPEPNGARAYVCRHYACQEPADSVADLHAQLEE